MSDEPRSPLLKALVGVGLLAFAGHELATGKALVSQIRSGTLQEASRSVERQDDPLSFYVEILVGAGTGLYLLYRAATGNKD